MARRLASLTLDNLDDLPPRCRGCVYWELDPVAGERARQAGGTELEKEAWVSDTLLEWGSCGQLAYVDGAPAGYILYAPPSYVPRSVAFPTSPDQPGRGAADDGLPGARVPGHGAGPDAGAVDRARGGPARLPRGRGVRTPGGAPEADAGRYDADEEGTAVTHCLVPSDYLLAVGFKTIRPHPRTPRLRLDVKSTATWKADVEQALDRLLASMQTPVLARG